MQENWLQTIWGRQDWNGWPLQTCQGDPVRVLHPGKWNSDQGPDFLEAQIFIGSVFWVGSVELHIHSTDWFRHRHSRDPRYGPVILHVVWMQDPLHPDIPTLELSRYLSIAQLKQGALLLGEMGILPCQRVMRSLPSAVWNHQRLHWLSVRLNRRREALTALKGFGFRNRLARQMGSWVNREVFECIDASISDAMLRNVIDDPDRLTALYLGQAGLLKADAGDDYLNCLRIAYDEIRTRYTLNPPYRHLLWMRVRPSANPSYRLAQLAALIHEGWHLPDKWTAETTQSLRMEWKTIKLHSYWSDHWRLGGERMGRSQFFSDRLIDSLLINIGCYRNTRSEQELEDLLMKFEFEDNRFTRCYDALGISNATAADSQALMELNHSLCQRRECRRCALAHGWGQDQPPQSI